MADIWLSDLPDIQGFSQISYLQIICRLSADYRSKISGQYDYQSDSTSGHAADAHVVKSIGVGGIGHHSKSLFTVGHQFDEVLCRLQLLRSKYMCLSHQILT